MNNRRNDDGLDPAPTLRAEVASRGYAVADVEGSYFECLDAREPRQRLLSAGALAELARMQVLSDGEQGGFEYAPLGPDGEVAPPDPPDEDPLCSRAHWSTYVAQFRARTGRRFPTLYRLRVALEATPVPDAEAEDYWRALNARGSAARAASDAQLAADLAARAASDAQFDADLAARRAAAPPDGSDEDGCE